MPNRAFCCLEFDVMREINYSCLMMPPNWPRSARGLLFCATSIGGLVNFLPLLRHGLGDLRDQLFDDDVPE